MIVGWDVSTSAIGICGKTLEGETLGFSCIFPSGKTALEKHLSATRQITDFMQGDALRWAPAAPVLHYVEDRLGGFTGGLTTRQTLMSLAAMNAVVSYHLCSYGRVLHIPPITAKRIVGLVVPKGEDKKQVVVGLVRSREPSFPYAETAHGNPVKGTDDMADAWLLAEAGRLLETGGASLGRKSKATGRQKKARRAKAGSSSEG